MISFKDKVCFDNSNAIFQKDFSAEQIKTEIVAIAI